MTAQASLEQSINHLSEHPTPKEQPNWEKTLSEFMLALNTGVIRVAEKGTQDWHVNAWVKRGILLYFKLHQTKRQEGSPTPYFDKIPLKFADMTAADFQTQGVRITPGAIVREGTYVAPSTVLMPSFINIGAYIGEGSMIDTWATVGSCAQIGAHVHISGGVGIGGVLEPEGAIPVIIEDHCFIGARSEITEGVIIGEGAVLSMGVYLSQSTKIYDRETDTISFGAIPPGAVVVPGTLPSKQGNCHLQCAVIVKKVDLKTREKVGINQLLRSL